MSLDSGYIERTSYSQMKDGGWTADDDRKRRLREREELIEALKGLLAISRTTATPDGLLKKFEKEFAVGYALLSRLEGGK